MEKNKFLLIVWFVFIASCAVSQGKIKRIKLEYVSFDLETDTHVDCEAFEEDFKDQFKLRYIDDRRLLEKFAHYLDNAQTDKKNRHPDVRTKIYIYNKNGSVDTACLDRFALRLNNKSLTVSDDFRNFIKQLESKR